MRPRSVSAYSSGCVSLSHWWNARLNGWRFKALAGVRPRFAGVHDLLGVAETHVQHGTRDLDRVDGREAVTAQPSEGLAPAGWIGMGSCSVTRSPPSDQGGITCDRRSASA
jgi:hypothetical protein